VVAAAEDREDKTSVRPVHLAYAGVAGFFIVERLLRRGADARSFAARETDQGTTRALGQAFGLNLTVLAATPVLRRAGLGRHEGRGLAWSGVALLVGGLALRSWSAWVLGASYTRTLRTSVGQRIVEDGPYRLVRHPGYLGVLLLWLGAALAAENWIAPAAMVPLAHAYHRRIQAEEAMLTTTFGDDYARYAGRTWRLIPLVY
jgi:protein-S-isoprenylcysteine O-methyltransferase Ste14